MAFTWPSKKEIAEPQRAKPDFPSDLDLPGPSTSSVAIPSAAAVKTAGPVKARALESSPAQDDHTLLAVAQLLENLNKQTDEVKELMTSYLLHRESPIGQ